jgi:DNA-binding response OmpR family regulator
MRVLVAEDVEDLATAIAAGLRREGMAVDVVLDGTAALDQLAVTGYDVVVLDRDLPGLPGDTICTMIAAGDRPVMVLMLTASGAPAERVSGLRLGADDYLAKPFHFPELVLRVRALARRQPAARSRVFRGGGVELDPLRHAATRDGQYLDLSVKEFAVLEALMRASPGFLSAEDLLEEVWDEHADPFTRTVSVTVSRLRRKLGEPPLIETVAGLGYRLAGDGASTEPGGRSGEPG